MEQAERLVVSALEPVQQRGSWRFSESVEKQHDKGAKFVHVRVTGWDAEDKLVGMTHTYAAGADGIEPGATARYALSHSMPAADVVRFETTVSGRVKD